MTAPETLTTDEAVARARKFPRIRYMGSKYRLLPHLAEVFAEIGGATAVDAFSGSGVVSYLLKSQGYRVTSNDFLTFPGVIARATVANSHDQLSPVAVDRICGPAADDRDFISRKFDGLYFTAEDRAFLDSAWSHIDLLNSFEQEIALSALIQSAARKQPRGVFTFTDSSRYSDGRRDLQLTMKEHFREHVSDYNAAVFDNGEMSAVTTGDVLSITDSSPDVVYLDPPYAPPKDDNDYIKRYHFLEGLSAYWQGMAIMENTKTKKLEKRYTPFAYKRTIEDALRNTFRHFEGAGAIVLSYSSNALPSADRIVELLREVKSQVEVREIDYKYSFGTHAAATRRAVTEYLFIGRNA
ncbi:DNA adenine methylase [Corynebacterium variabile]|uniref:DNA adenine methylase n=1 Tax=Corynebacterium variabile TaxID=1727 RepID=UPI003F923CEF